MSLRKLLRGSKITKNHSTVIEDAERLALKAKALPSVKKVVTGPIVRVGGGQPRLKFVPIPAGLQLQVRSQGRQQILFIYTNIAMEVEQLLQEAWDSIHC